MESNNYQPSCVGDILGPVSLLYLNQKLLRSVPVPPVSVQILELQAWHLDALLRKYYYVITTTRIRSTE